MVVDDYDDNRSLYASTIAEAGYPVAEATNGQEALDKIAAEQPAVVVMDLSMPVLDGWETIHRIKGDPRTADIIVIALTANSTSLGLRRATSAGAQSVLMKPCLPHDLLGVIAALIRSTKRD